VRVGSESDSVGGGQPSRGFERRWRGRKEDVGVTGKVEEVGDEGAVGGREEKFSKVGVGGGEGVAGSAWMTHVNRGGRTRKGRKTDLITIGKCGCKSGTARGHKTPRVHLAKKAIERMLKVCIVLGWRRTV
jgi:hypothetical protein